MTASRKPHPKVVAGGVAGAISLLLVGILRRAGVELDVMEAQALTVVLGAIAGYMKRGH